MNPDVRMAEIPWTEYDRRVREEQAMVLLPVGALEQHGPHLPMNCDSVIPEAMSERIAARLRALVAPTLCYGYKSQPRSGGGNHFPGTTSLDGQTLSHQVRDIIREFARHGVRRVAVMVGHMENTWFTIEGIDLALRDLRAEGIRDMKVVRADYWEFVTAQTLETLFPDGFPGWALEHAGVMETSVMMHLHPELVHVDRIPTHPGAQFPPYDVYPIDPARVPASGALSSATTATAEKGRVLVDNCVDDITDALAEEFGIRRSG